MSGRDPEKSKNGSSVTSELLSPFSGDSEDDFASPREYSSPMVTSQTDFESAAQGKHVLTSRTSDEGERVVASESTKRNEPTSGSSSRERVSSAAVPSVSDDTQVLGLDLIRELRAELMREREARELMQEQASKRESLLNRRISSLEGVLEKERLQHQDTMKKIKDTTPHSYSSPQHFSHSPASVLSTSEQRERLSLSIPRSASNPVAHEQHSRHSRKPSRTLSLTYSDMSHSEMAETERKPSNPLSHSTHAEMASSILFEVSPRGSATSFSATTGTHAEEGAARSTLSQSSSFDIASPIGPNDDQGNGDTNGHHYHPYRHPSYNHYQGNGSNGNGGLAVGQGRVRTTNRNRHRHRVQTFQSQREWESPENGTPSSPPSRNGASSRAGKSFDGHFRNLSGDSVATPLGSSTAASPPVVNIEYLPVDREVSNEHVLPFSSAKEMDDVNQPHSTTGTFSQDASSSPNQKDTPATHNNNNKKTAPLATLFQLAFGDDDDDDGDEDHGAEEEEEAHTGVATKQKNAEMESNGTTQHQGARDRSNQAGYTEASMVPSKRVDATADEQRPVSAPVDNRSRPPFRDHSRYSSTSSAGGGFLSRASSSDALGSPNCVLEDKIPSYPTTPTSTSSRRRIRARNHSGGLPGHPPSNNGSRKRLVPYSNKQHPNSPAPPPHPNSNRNDKRRSSFSSLTRLQSHESLYSLSGGGSSRSVSMGSIESFTSLPSKNLSEPIPEENVAMESSPVSYPKPNENEKSDYEQQMFERQDVHLSPPPIPSLPNGVPDVAALLDQLNALNTRLSQYWADPPSSTAPRGFVSNRYVEPAQRASHGVVEGVGGRGVLREHNQGENLSSHQRVLRQGEQRSPHKATDTDEVAALRQQLEESIRAVSALSPQQLSSNHRALQTFHSDPPPRHVASPYDGMINSMAPSPIPTGPRMGYGRGERSNTQSPASFSRQVPVNTPTEELHDSYSHSSPYVDPSEIESLAGYTPVSQATNIRSDAHFSTSYASTPPVVIHGTHSPFHALSSPTSQYFGHHSGNASPMLNGSNASGPHPVMREEGGYALSPLYGSQQHDNGSIGNGAPASTGYSFERTPTNSPAPMLSSPPERKSQVQAANYGNSVSSPHVSSLNGFQDRRNKLRHLAAQNALANSGSPNIVSENFQSTSGQPSPPSSDPNPKRHLMLREKKRPMQLKAPFDTPSNTPLGSGTPSTAITPSHSPALESVYLGRRASVGNGSGVSESIDSGFPSNHSAADSKAALHLFQYTMTAVHGTQRSMDESPSRSNNNNSRAVQSPQHRPYHHPQANNSYHQQQQQQQQPSRFIHQNQGTQQPVYAQNGNGKKGGRSASYSSDASEAPMMEHQFESIISPTHGSSSYAASSSGGKMNSRSRGSRGSMGSLPSFTEMESPSMYESMARSPQSVGYQFTFQQRPQQQ